jgi:hypothetical protein
MSVDELHGPSGITHDGEACDIVALLAELPDLWDVNVSGTLGNDSKSARFSPEAFQENYVRFVKTLTSKPVVGVGRFTSPETMLAQIRDGILDFVGAAAGTRFASRHGSPRSVSSWWALVPPVLRRLSRLASVAMTCHWPSRGASLVAGCCMIQHCRDFRLGSGCATIVSSCWGN